MIIMNAIGAGQFREFRRVSVLVNGLHDDGAQALDESVVFVHFFRHA